MHSPMMGVEPTGLTCFNVLLIYCIMERMYPVHAQVGGGFMVQFGPVLALLL